MSYTDLREWIRQVDEMGELKGFSSRMIIDACRPFKWRDKFPPAAEISAERRRALMQKWEKELFS